MPSATWNSGASTDMNNTANYSAVWDATYDLVWDNTSVVNCTATGNISCNSITVNANYSGAWSISGRTLTVTLGASWDGTGTLNLGNSITANGASSTVHFGSGVGAVTGSSCVLTMNGTTAMIIDDDKGTTLKSLTIGTGAIVTNSGAQNTTLTPASGGTPLTIGNNATLTINKTLVLSPQGIATVFSIGTGVTFNGTAQLTIQEAGAGTFTMSAVTYTGTGGLFWGAATASSLSMGGNLSWAGGAVIFRNNANNSVTINTGNYALTTGDFRMGNNSAAGTLNFNAGSSIINVSGWNSAALYNVNVTNINLQTSQITCTGNWTFGSNHTINAGSSLVTTTNTSNITSSTKSFYDFTINAAAKTITLADALTCASGGDLTITAGTLNTSTFAVTVGANFAINGTSTYTGTGTTLSVGGNMTTAAGCTFTVGGGATVTFTGTAGTQQITCNGKTFPNTTHNGAGGTVELQDAITFGTLTLTAGAFDQNGKTVTVSSLTWNSNSAGNTLDAAISCGGNLSRGAASAGTITGTITITATANITSNGKSYASIVSNPGAGNTVTLIDAFSSTDDLTVSTGIFNTAGFTVTVTDDISINGTSTWTANNSTVNIGDNYTTAVGTTINTNAATSYIFTSNTAVVTTNGKALPQCTVNGVLTAVNGACTIARLIYGTDGVVVTLQSGLNYTISNLAAANWNGAVGAVNELRSSLDGVTVNLTIPNNITVEYCYFRDMNVAGGVVTAPWGDGCRSGGGNTNIVFGTNLQAVAYDAPTLTVTCTGEAFAENQYAPVGDIEIAPAGTGLWASVAAFGVWGDTVATGTLAAILGPGSYDFRLTSGDGEQSILANAVFVAVLGGSVGGASRCWVSAAIGI